MAHFFIVLSPANLLEESNDDEIQNQQKLYGTWEQLRRFGIVWPRLIHQPWPFGNNHCCYVPMFPGGGLQLQLFQLEWMSAESWMRPTKHKKDQKKNFLIGLTGG